MAVWVAVDSPGPVFFRQRRVGPGGRVFRTFKFRTMRHEAPMRGPGITVQSDARVTRSGHTLQRLKTDEVPQLINVLRGDMSLVGPRPELEQYVALYPPDAARRIASVQPGMTGLASLAFRDESDLLGRAADPEATYRRIILPAKLAYDLRYVDEQSVWRDMKIIMQTVAAVLTQAKPHDPELPRA